MALAVANSLAKAEVPVHMLARPYRLCRVRPIQSVQVARVVVPKPAAVLQVFQAMPVMPQLLIHWLYAPVAARAVKVVVLQPSVVIIPVPQ